MPLSIFELIYREFVRARLTEMHKQLFLIRRDPEVDTDQPDQGDFWHQAERHAPANCSCDGQAVCNADGKA
jgi:hypothetical protein